MRAAHDRLPVIGWQRVFDAAMVLCWLSLGITIELLGTLTGAYRYGHWWLAAVVAVVLFGMGASALQFALRGRHLAFAAAIFASAVTIEWTNLRWLHLWRFHPAIAAGYTSELALAASVSAPLAVVALIMSLGFSRAPDPRMFALPVEWREGAVHAGPRTAVFAALCAVLAVAFGRYGNADYLIHPLGIHALAQIGPLDPRLPVRPGDLGAAGAIVFFAFQAALTIAAALLAAPLCRTGPALLGLGRGAIGLRDGLPLLVFFAVFPLPGFVIAGFDPAMASNYPFVQQFDRVSSFVAYEVGYLLFFLAIEVLFRSLLFLGFGAVLTPADDASPGGSGQAMFVSSILSSLCYVFWHLGKPVPELLGAIVWGPLACVIVWRTRNIAYLVIPHWLWNSTLDVFVTVRRMRLFPW